MLHQANPHLRITCTDDRGVALANASVTSDYFVGGLTGDFPGCPEPCLEITGQLLKTPVAFDCSLTGHRGVANQFIPISTSVFAYNATVELKV